MCGQQSVEQPVFLSAAAVEPLGTVPQWGTSQATTAAGQPCVTAGTLCPTCVDTYQTGPWLEGNLHIRYRTSSQTSRASGLLVQVPRCQISSTSRTGTALKPPRASTGCGRATTYMGYRTTAQKRLLKDWPTHAVLQLPHHCRTCD